MTAPTVERAALVAGLRELADFAEANPDLPFNYTVDLSYCVLANNDADGITELGRVATILGKPVNKEYDGAHLGVRRHFGGLSYRAYYVMRQDAAEYDEDCKLVRDVREGRLVAVPATEVVDPDTDNPADDTVANGEPDDGWRDEATGLMSGGYPPMLRANDAEAVTR